MSTDNMTREEEIRTIWKGYKFFYQIVGGIALVVIVMLIGNVLFDGDPGYLINLYTDVISIAITVFILDRLSRKREEQSLRRQLIREMGSSYRGVARRAIEELRHHGWLYGDGLFHDSQLNNADIGDALLAGAKLQGVHLDEANLEAVTLIDSDLREATLIEANLTNAKLQNSDFRKAQLFDAKLEGANLIGANLTDAELSGVKYDEKTILPDGCRWMPDADLTRFTNPRHPDFWFSDDPNSPAYRGR